MNIFVLDYNFDKCAQYHVDKHISKLSVEATQLLNNALIINNLNYNPVYKPTHLKHPASIWTSKSRENFDWLVNLGLALCKEYTYRYSKTHKCESIILSFQTSCYRDNIPDICLTPFVKCMPDQYKVEDSVESYRNYYRGEKAYIAKWTNRSVPEWWELH
jgi:hypothetical protein